MSKPRAKAKSQGIKSRVTRLQEAAESVIMAESDEFHGLLNDTTPTSRFLDIPAEIRLSIYKLCLPCNEKLVLDPQYIKYAPRYRCSYEATTSLLRVSIKVHSEVIPLVYSRNTTTIIEPMRSLEFGENLSEVGLSQVRDIEVCVKRGLADLARLFRLFPAALPLARNLRLNFPRYKPDDVLTCLGELAWRAWVHQQYLVKIELHKLQEGSWVNRFPGLNVEWFTATKIVNAIVMGSDQAQVYDLRLPVQLKVITIAFSAERSAHEVFSNSRGQNTSGDKHQIDWRFNKDGNKDTEECKYLVWDDRKPV